MRKDEVFFYYPSEGGCEESCSVAKIQVLGPVPCGGLVVRYLEVSECPACGMLADVKAGDRDIIYPAKVKIFCFGDDNGKEESGISGIIWGSKLY